MYIRIVSLHQLPQKSSIPYRNGVYSSAKINKKTHNIIASHSYFPYTIIKKADTNNITAFVNKTSMETGYCSLFFTI